MKKTFRSYIGIWAVLLALFNIIAFVSPGWEGQEKYTASFWIGYGFITTAFVGQLLCAKVAFGAKNLEKLFYNIPLIRLSYIGLVCSFVFGGVCMLVPALPYWVSVILCAIVLAVNVIAVLKAGMAADTVAAVDEKIKVQTAFVKLLTVDAENLLQRAKSEQARAACKKVYEAARYSDPMSSDGLISVEAKISEKMEVLISAVADGKDEAIIAAAEEVTLLIGDRNRKCKVLK